jgi:hypothetical protein
VVVADEVAHEDVDYVVIELDHGFIKLYRQSI